MATASLLSNDSSTIDDADVVSHFRAARATAEPDQVAAHPGLRMGCTVAICTYRRCFGLSRFLDSLAEQQFRPQQLIIVDASPGDDSEQMLRQRSDRDRWADRIEYYRVAGRHKGLTRQRNFALARAAYDLIAFFDDDVVLMPDCLQELERAHRRCGAQAVGIGAFIDQQFAKPKLLWRVRRSLGMVSHLQPGKYCGSGMALPWAHLRPTSELVPGDWLSGCAFMWKTEVARQLRFNDRFHGYSVGEDLDFSLRMSAHGKLYVAGTAHALHLQESSGRPDSFALGYSSLANQYHIHRHSYRGRTAAHQLWFFYAYAMDTLLRSVYILRPGQTAARAKFLLGRAYGLFHVVFGRLPQQG